jgi:hypothetical protein
MARRNKRAAISRRTLLVGGAAFGSLASRRVVAQAPELLRIGFLTVKTGPLAAGGRQQAEGAAYYLKRRRSDLVILHRCVRQLRQADAGSLPRDVDLRLRQVHGMFEIRNPWGASNGRFDTTFEVKLADLLRYGDTITVDNLGGHFYAASAPLPGSTSSVLGLLGADSGHGSTMFADPLAQQFLAPHA